MTSAHSYVSFFFFFTNTDMFCRLFHLRPTQVRIACRDVASVGVCGLHLTNSKKSQHRTGGWCCSESLPWREETTTAATSRMKKKWLCSIMAHTVCVQGAAALERSCSHCINDSCCCYGLELLDVFKSHGSMFKEAGCV